MRAHVERSRLARTIPLLLLALAACRSEHNLDQPPPGYRPPPAPLEHVKQSFDPKSGRLTHEWSELAYADRRAVKQGPETKYFPSGQKMWEGSWRAGQKSGTWRFWYENGVLKSETIYAGTRTPTTMTFWHPNGKIALQGPAIDGSRQGKWQVWSKDGLLSEEGPYVGSVREGTWKIYTSDGKQVTEVVYAKNRRVSAGSPQPCEPVRQAAEQKP